MTLSNQTEQGIEFDLRFDIWLMHAHFSNTPPVFRWMLFSLISQSYLKASYAQIWNLKIFQSVADYRQPFSRFIETPIGLCWTKRLDLSGRLIDATGCQLF